MKLNGERPKRCRKRTIPPKAENHEKRLDILEICGGDGAGDAGHGGIGLGGVRW